jgi:hypothetical protein
MHASLAPGKRSWPPREEMATMYPCVLSKAGSAALWGIRCGEVRRHENLSVMIAARKEEFFVT